MKIIKADENGRAAGFMACTIVQDGNERKLIMRQINQAGYNLIERKVNGKEPVYSLERSENDKK